jgi:hypothetical protein
MKINRTRVCKPIFLNITSLKVGCTYTDTNTGHLWLVCGQAYVDLTDNRVVTRTDNMPGCYQDGRYEARYKEVNCEIEVTEI